MGQTIPGAIQVGAIFDRIDDIEAAATPDDAWRIYLDMSIAFGLAHGMLHSCAQAPGSHAQMLAAAMPPGYLEGYRGNGLLQGDLLLERARGAGHPFDWLLTDWPADKLTAQQRRWVEHNRAFGIEGGLCLVTFRPGEMAVLTLCGQPAALTARDRKVLFFLGHEIVNRCLQVQADPGAPVWLSGRERECLRWAAAGKTDWEIGQILSLSEKTVNVYITRAKTKFGVKSRAQAILLASRAGHIPG